MIKTSLRFVACIAGLLAALPAQSIVHPWAGNYAPGSAGLSGSMEPPGIYVRTQSAGGPVTTTAVSPVEMELDFANLGITAEVDSLSHANDDFYPYSATVGVRTTTLHVGTTAGGSIGIFEIVSPSFGPPFTRTPSNQSVVSVGGTSTSLEWTPTAKFPVFFTVSPNTANTLRTKFPNTLATVESSDILCKTSATADPYIYISKAELNLQANDRIDCLSMTARKTVMFKLGPGSPSLLTPIPWWNSASGPGTPTASAFYTKVSAIELAQLPPPPGYGAGPNVWWDGANPAPPTGITSINNCRVWDPFSNFLGVGTLPPKSGNNGTPASIAAFNIDNSVGSGDHRVDTLCSNTFGLSVKLDAPSNIDPYWIIYATFGPVGLQTELKIDANTNATLAYPVADGGGNLLPGVYPIMGNFPLPAGWGSYMLGAPQASNVLAWATSSSPPIAPSTEMRVVYQTVVLYVDKTTGATSYHTGNALVQNVMNPIVP